LLVPRSICLSAAAVFIAAASVGVAGASSRPPALSVANGSAAQDAGSIVFTVRLSRRTSKRVTVRYATADGSATAGSDYSAVRGRLVFKPGQRVLRLPVPVIASSAPEDEETFFLVLSHATNARIARLQAQGKILAHDLPAEFKAHATLTGEPGAGTGECTLTLDAATEQTSYVLRVAGMREDPGHGHIHSAKDSTLGVNIFPLPSKDGSVTGTVFLARKQIIDIHEDPGNYIIEIHSPTFSSTIRGVLSLVSP